MTRGRQLKTLWPRKLDSTEKVNAMFNYDDYLTAIALAIVTAILGYGIWCVY